MRPSLKRLPPSGLDAAVKRAEHYRALNDPESAESICRDVLLVDAEHAAAKRLLGLSLTDQFGRAWSRYFDEALALFQSLKQPYERVYYLGIAWERCAKAQLAEGQSHNALHAYEEALRYFSEAESLLPESADPILHWNHCVRALENEAIRKAEREPHLSGFEVSD